MKWLSFLIPRIFLLLLVSFSVWMAKDSLIRQAIIAHGQRLTEAKVEVGQVQTDFGQHRILIKNLKMADPRTPMSNLFQADTAYLKFDPQELWRRKFVILDGQIHGLVVNAPRTETGALPSTPADSNIVTAKLAKGVPLPAVDKPSQAKLEPVSQRWLNQVNPRTGPLTISFESESLHKTLLNDWSARLKSYADRVDKLQPHFREIADSVGNGRGLANPLRDRERVEQSETELVSLRQQASRLQHDLDVDLQQLNAEVAKLQQALERDRLQLSKRQPTNQFDENLVSELLLTQESQEMVSDVIQWLAWFHQSLPNGHRESIADGNSENSKGKGSSEVTNLFIKKVDLEGSGWFARQPLNFVGTAYNFSSQPQTMNQPARIELRALGKANVLVDFMVDRTGDNRMDQLRIQFPDLEFRQRQFGHEQSMLVSFGENRRANADMVLEIRDQQIAGTVQLRYSQVSMHVDSLSGMLGGDEFRLRINQGLSQLNQFKATLVIAGELDNYTMEIKSDLGTQFASIVDSSVVERIEQQNQRLTEDLERAANETMATIRDGLQSDLQKLAGQINLDIDRIAELEQSLDSHKESGWRKLR